MSTHETTATLSELIDRVESTRATIRVYAPEPVPAVEDSFAGMDVRVEHVPLEASADNRFLTVHRGDQFLGAVGLAELPNLDRNSIPPPADPSREESAYGQLLSVLSEETFQTFDRRQMLAIAREIEDRSWRVGDGELHTAFQSSAAFAGQRQIYEKLADRGSLTVRCYVGADEPPPASDPLTVYAVDSAALGAVWTVAYHGPAGGTALVGEERADGFVGFWTDDSDCVATVIETLQALES